MIFNFFSKKNNKKNNNLDKSYTKNIIKKDETINILYQDEDFNTLDLDKLRAVSRERARTNSIISAYSRLGENNVVGKGFKLKISKNQKFAFNSKLEKQILADWNEFIKKENFDSANKLDINEFCRLLTKNLLIDGENLIKIIREDKSEINKFGLQFQTIDITRLDTNKNTSNTRKGIEFDERGRAVKYYLRKQVENPLGLKSNKFEEDGFEKAENIIHFFKTNFSEQSRGVPFTAPALEQIKNLEQFEKLTMKAAHVGTLLSVYIKKNEINASDINNLDNPSFNDIALSSGGIYQLQSGESIEGFKGDYPSDLYNNFVFNKIKLISRSLGLTPTFLANEWAGANYAIARFMSNEDRQFYRMIQKFIIENFLNKVFKEFLQTLVLNFDYNAKILNLEFDFIASDFEEIDATKTQAAKNTELKSFRKSFSELSNEEGRDFKETVSQYREDLETIAKELDVDKKELINNFLNKCFN